MGNEDGVHDTSRLLNNDESIATPSNGIDNVPASGIIYRRSWQSTLNFSWINPLLDWLRHPDAHLTNAHLPPLSLDLRPEVCAARLWQHLNKKHSENKSIQPTLLKSLARAYGRSYLLLGILKLFSDALNFAPALLLNRLLHYLDEDTGEKDTPKLTDLFYSWGFRYALLLKFSLALKAFLNAHYSYQLGLLVAKVRMAISSTVFNKTIDVKAAALASIGEGNTSLFMCVIHVIYHLLTGGPSLESSSSTATNSGKETRNQRFDGRANIYIFNLYICRSCTNLDISRCRPYRWPMLLLP